MQKPLRYEGLKRLQEDFISKAYGLKDQRYYRDQYMDKVKEAEKNDEPAPDPDYWSHRYVGIDSYGYIQHWDKDEDIPEDLILTFDLDDDELRRKWREEYTIVKELINLMEASKKSLIEDIKSL
jgi:hypothetical protein